MNPLKRRLMIHESESRLRAADLLSYSDDSSDSAYLLRLLAFELLLKLIFEEAVGRPAPHRHRYEKIFGELPPGIRTELLHLAGVRVGPSALNSDPDCVLKVLGDNFVQLRYPYDKYAGLDEDGYRMLTSNWIAGGAKLEDASFRYYPEELLGLTYAVQQYSSRSSAPLAMGGADAGEPAVDGLPPREQGK